MDRTVARALARGSYGAGMKLMNLVLIGVSVSSATAAWGQHDQTMPLLPIIVALDADRDGFISAEEIKAAPRSLLTLDKNKDGKLSKDEYLGNQLSSHRIPALPIITALDANGDGVIDAREIANAGAALKTLDKNGDGKLTRDEFLPNH
jgi:Ca2+-binding EF-hand superfamily protein